MRILLIEDDENLGKGIVIGLSQQGYTVDWLTDGAAAHQAVLNEAFDAVVLDVGLPKMTGIELLASIRNRGNVTPVLILTARDTLDDRIAGLDSGGDDYMTKPFELEELYARLRALVRRHSGRAESCLQYGEIVLDPASHSVTFQNQPINLSRREFALLHKLLDNTGRVLSREHLTQSLYGWEDDVDSNALEVHIHNLRKKFGAQFIRTIRGVGYMIDKE